MGHWKTSEKLHNDVSMYIILLSVYNKPSTLVMMQMFEIQYHNYKILKKA